MSISVINHLQTAPQPHHSPLYILLSYTKSLQCLIHTATRVQTIISPPTQTQSIFVHRTSPLIHLASHFLGDFLHDHVPGSPDSTYSITGVSPPRTQRQYPVQIKHHLNCRPNINSQSLFHPLRDELHQPANPPDDLQQSFCPKMLHIEHTLHPSQNPLLERDGCAHTPGIVATLTALQYNTESDPINPNESAHSTVEESCGVCTSNVSSKQNGLAPYKSEKCTATHIVTN